MIMDEALSALKKTVNDWNAWRTQHPDTVLQFTIVT